MRKSDSLQKILMLGKIEGKKRRVPQRVRWLDSITDLLDTYLSKLQEIVDREAWHAEVHGFQIFRCDWATELQQIIMYGFPGDSVVKNLTTNASNSGAEISIPGSGSSPRGGNGNRPSILAWKILDRSAGNQAPLSMEFPRQEYWSGLTFPSPGIFPIQGSNPDLLHCRQIPYHLSHQGSILK